jgi:hypothetical protein
MKDESTDFYIGIHGYKSKNKVYKGLITLVENDLTVIENNLSHYYKKVN